MPGTAREVSRFLKLFSSTENHRFAVIKIGGAVVEENLDELAKQLAFLHRVGLYVWLCVFPLPAHSASQLPYRGARWRSAAQ